MVNIENIEPGDELRYHEFGEGTYLCRVLGKSGNLIKIQLISGPDGGRLVGKIKRTVTAERLSALTPSPTTDQLEQRLVIEILPTTRGGRVLRLTCPKCGRRFQVGTDCLGLRTRCQACGAVIMLPREIGAEPDVSASDAPAAAAPNAPGQLTRPVRRPNGVRRDRVRRARCPICGAGSMMRRKEYRLARPAVVTGFLIMAAAGLGVVASAIMFVFVGSAAGRGAFERELIVELQNAKVPAAMIKQIQERGKPEAESLQALTASQRGAVRESRLYLQVQDLGLDLGILSAGGHWLARTGASFLVVVLGWLLVTRRSILQCGGCGTWLPTAPGPQRAPPA